MQRSKSLKVVLSLAEQAEQQAARALREQRIQLESQQRQLREITAYNNQYAEQISQLGSRDIHQFTSQRNFLGQLGELIRAQSETVGVLEQQAERARNHWQSEYVRRKTIADLIEKIEREEDLAQQKRLQKELDEISILMFANNQLH
jgi:flagellar FliJ protein